MRAWQYSRAGRSLAAALTLNPSARRPPTPLPANKLLVRVTHMSPNPIDHKLPEAVPFASALAMGSFTATPGLDYAGVVEEVGSSINNHNNHKNNSNSSSSATYKPGDAVFGRVEPNAFGTLGEYVQPLASGCAPIPPSVSPSDASTLGTAAQTAYQAIQPYVRAGAGDEVFVNGGSGGVGTYAIQIAARALGCVVTTSCSARNAALCTSLGATTVLDYTSADTDIVAALRGRGRVFRLVVDAVGSAPSGLYAAAADYMLPDGVFVQVGAEFSLAGMRGVASRALLPRFLGGGQRAWRFLNMVPRHEDLAQLARWLQDGTIRAVIDGDIIPFEEAPRAFEKLATHRTRGKLVVKVSD